MRLQKTTKKVRIISFEDTWTRNLPDMEQERYQFERYQFDRYVRYKQFGIKHSAKVTRT